MITPVAILRTCYPDKFGVPRQSGLAPDAWGVIEFEPAFRRSEAVRGIDQFSHLWLITLFHLVEEGAPGLTVRPPRLGGNERRGVFATRSPFRPNRIGLSVVKLERVEEDIPRLYVTGVDFVDGTPILDIKPYVPYADSIPEARSSFANAAPTLQKIVWMTASPDDVQARAIIDQSLALQPQPAYHENAEREYATEIAGWHVRWKMTSDSAVILQCTEST